MTDIVVSIAREKWPDWLRTFGSQDRPGRRMCFHIFGDRPPASEGDLLYVASHGRVRCVFDIDYLAALRGGWFIIGRFARPATIHAFVQGFPGWRRRTWHPAEETPFPAWRTEAVSTPKDEPELAHGKTRS